MVDETLVALARGGDERAFEALVRRHSPLVHRVALRVLGSPGDAEDVTQEVFLTAWRRIDQLQDGAAFGAWLRRATTNRCLTLLQGRRTWSPLDSDSPDTSPCRPDRVVELAAQVIALATALDQLTPDQRQAWLAREVHGRTYEEIADETRSTVPAVRGRLSRARSKVAIAMAPWR